MSKISILKKIQLGVNSFPIETPDFEVPFNFYCGNGGIKHEAIISFKNSNFLSSLLETGAISSTDLAENNIVKLQNLEDRNGPFSHRYQMYNSKECKNDYLIIFDIHEYRDYYSCFIYAVLQIESSIPRFEN